MNEIDKVLNEGSELIKKADQILKEEEEQALLQDNVSSVIDEIIDTIDCDDVYELVEEVVDDYIDENEAKIQGFDNAYDYYMSSVSLVIENDILDDIIDDTEKDLGIVLSEEEKQEVKNFCFANYINIDDEEQVKSEEPIDESKLDEIVVRRSSSQRKAIKLARLKRKSGAAKAKYKKSLKKAKIFYKKNKRKIKKKVMFRKKHPNKIRHFK